MHRLVCVFATQTCHKTKVCMKTLRHWKWFKHDGLVNGYLFTQRTVSHPGSYDRDLNGLIVKTNCLWTNERRNNAVILRFWKFIAILTVSRHLQISPSAAVLQDAHENRHCRFSPYFFLMPVALNDKINAEIYSKFEKYCARVQIMYVHTI